MIEFSWSRQAACILRQPSRERFAGHSQPSEKFAEVGIRCKPLAVEPSYSGVQM
jgi:hypothetical protein